jgi:hypothetical protein
LSVLAEVAAWARASAPRKILFDPVVRFDPALYPTAVLFALVRVPVATTSRASRPIATLLVPRK